MKKVLLILIAINPILLWGQNDIDTLKIILKTELIKNDRENNLLKIIEYYTQRGRLDRDSIRKYNNFLLTLLENEPLSKNKASAKAYRLLADYRIPYDEYAPLAKDLINDYKELQLYEGVLKEHYYLCSKAQRADIPESTTMYEDGIRMTQEYSNDLDPDILCRYKVRFMSSLASNLGHLKLHEQGIKQAISSVEVAETCGDSLGQLYAYRTAGAILGNAEKEITSIQDSSLNIKIELKRLLNKTLLYARKLNETPIIALATYNLAFYHYHNGSNDQALRYLEESESLPDLKWIPKQKYLNQILFSDIYWDLGNKKSSYAALSNAKLAADELNENFFSSQIHLNFSNWDYKNNEFNKSLLALKEIEIDRTNDLEIKTEYYQYLTRIEHALSNYKNAFTAQQEYYILKDSIENISSAKSIASLMGQYHISRANEEIASLKSHQLSNKLKVQRQSGIGILGFLCLIGFIGAKGFNYKQRLNQSRQDHQNVLQQLFRAQMNPHFIFNTLGSIQSYLLQPDRAKDGAYYISKFSKLMRQILTQSQIDLIPLDEELKTLENYLLLQKMRFDHQFEYSIIVSPDINTNISLPPMIIQPIIENAIEHGKIHTQENGQVIINFSERENNIEISVSDNGLGITAASNKNNADKSSISTEIIRQRLKSLSNEYRHNSKLQFLSPEKGGTEVLITIPKIEYK